MMAATFGPTLGRYESSPAFPPPPPLINVADPDTLPPASSRRTVPMAISNFAFPPQLSPRSDDLADSDKIDHSASTSPSLTQLRFPTHHLGRSHKPSALPDFNFNPGASLHSALNSPSFLSPPNSPHTPNFSTSPSRLGRHGHRRGGSEFVGGNIRDGSSIAVMSTSPTKDGGFSLPSSSSSSSSQAPRRRGHRRGLSGSISINELPILPRPPLVDSAPKGSSAPNSPTNFDRGIHATIPLLDEPPHMPALPDPIQEPVMFARSILETKASPPPSPKPVKAATRARVDFSDTLEFIPRPLSLVSSDTSSTITARPSQCMSGSTSSLVPPAPSTDNNTSATLSRGPIREVSDSRPSTAGAILESISTTDAALANSSIRRRNSIPTLIASESAATSPPLPSPNKSSKRWTFFGLESFGPSTATVKARPISSGSDDSGSRALTLSSSDRGSDSEAADYSKSKQKRSKDKSKKSKTETVKGWAGSVLPIKTKLDKRWSKAKLARPPTPPPSVTPKEEEEDEKEAEEDVAEEDNDEDDEVQDRHEVPALTLQIQPPQSTAATQQSPPSQEITSPIIDLDAALGPFNTPLPMNPEWEAAQRAAGNAGRRRLHSAQGMRGFAGPGMHYHRRAESAPDLPPFDDCRAAIHRFASNSTMADVFEEEEEEEADEHGEAGNSDRSNVVIVLSNTGMKTVPPKTESMIANDSASETMSFGGLAVQRSKSSGLGDHKDQVGARSVRTECSSKTSLYDEVIEETPSHSATMPHSPAMTPCHRSSFDSPASSLRGHFQTQNNSEPPPVDAVPLTLAQGALSPLSPYSMSTASLRPSPRSLMSIDVQRASTAASSVTEDKSFQSLLMGEPGPEVRISMDYDITSLTSSTTTRTRESGFNLQSRPLSRALREQRPSSVSSAAFGRRRSSLISLTRLINSSHGERSKLSMELTFEEAEAKALRKSKTKKLGRMMQFWKPNNKNAPSIRNEYAERG